MAKVYGHEIVRFFESEWPEDWYVDDNCKTVDSGKIYECDCVGSAGTELPLDKKYDLDDFGALIVTDSKDPKSLSTFFNKWKKSLSVISLIVEVPIDKQDEVKQLVVGLGCKIRK